MRRRIGVSPSQKGQALKRQHLRPLDRYNCSCSHTRKQCACLPSLRSIWLALLMTVMVRTAAAQPVTVYSPEDLKQAVASGAQDIILADHMDVSAATGDPDGYVLNVQPTTRSIRGICHHPPPGGFLPRHTPAPPRQPSQCVVVAASNLLRINQTESQLWLLGLYVRVARQRAAAARPTLLAVLAGSVWATQVTLEGFQQPGLAVLVSSGSKAIFQTSAITNFVLPKADAGARLVHAMDALSFIDSTFANNTLPGSQASLIYLSGPGALRLQRVAFAGSSATHSVLAASPANVVFWDAANVTYAAQARGAGVAARRPQPLVAAGQEGGGVHFLPANSSWLIDLQMELSVPPSAPAVLPHAKVSGRDTAAALIFVGIVTGCIFALIACCATCIFVRRRCESCSTNDSLDSEPDFWTSNGIASQKDDSPTDPFAMARKHPPSGGRGRLTTYSSRVLRTGIGRGGRGGRLPPEATRLPAVPEDHRLGGMGTESSNLSRDSSLMSTSNSRPRAWW
eukprot:jgi/Ulvmu1/12572/UM092_0002.1